MLTKLSLNKFFNKLNLRTLYLSVGIGLFGAFSSAMSFAEAATGTSTAIDYTQLTNSLNFNSVMTGILAVAGGLIAVYAGMAGVKWVLRMVRGA
ncbi:major capsid protein (plasmid) [Arsenophonus nasoniae]|uniref:Major capsid protein n=1 Tax=Arsenophonus nasoniae TaxID=638 RepID=A0A4P7LAR9_9GAMM|nr:major capsid protein [Arsenophonus nasoniae]QBY43580.1 hypothetical protein ArsFIN_21480 [Arsenophonus nasoniae]QBY46232.1 hypothetical protein ArsFIN_48430 [Arsenophonus nasoniae]WGM07590.1 major capsid protein [Arsenophonus nasoniae]WGM08152.1 major capsid protein [Arsenophonus nasoniae]WGM12392.1 major capsid protein [Arsenophonus nasoniae]